MCGIIRVGGVSKPSTSSPHSSFTENDAGPRSTSWPLPRHQSAAACEQRVGDGLVVDALEEAEEPDPVAVGLVVQAVADRGDAADDLAVALGEEVLGLGVLEEGILARGRAGVATSRRNGGTQSGSRACSRYGRSMKR